MLFNQQENKKLTSKTILITEDFRKKIDKEFNDTFDRLNSLDVINVKKEDKNKVYINVIDSVNYKIQRKTNRHKASLDLSRLTFPVIYNEENDTYSLDNFKNHKGIKEDDLEDYIYNLILREFNTATKLICMNF